MSQAEHIALTVLVERRASTNRWAEDIWRPAAVLPGRQGGAADAGAANADAEQPRGEGWQVVPGREGVTTYRAGTYAVELHPTEAEAYLYNLTMRNPSVMVVLAPHSGDVPWRLHLVTLSPHEAESYLVAGDMIVEPVPIPDEVRSALREFAERHYKPEPFRKRQRDRAPGEEAPVFGKEPIFAPGGRRKGDGDE